MLPVIEKDRRLDRTELQRKRKRNGGIETAREKGYGPFALITNVPHDSVPYRSESPRALLRRACRRRGSLALCRA